MATMSREIIEAAIEGFEAKKVRIDAQLAELRGMLNGGAPAPAVKSGRVGKRHFSPEAIKRMREAQQRRWAKIRGESAPAKTAATNKPKRRMSAAGRKAIAEAQRKRWAAKKAAA